MKSIFNSGMFRVLLILFFGGIALTIFGIIEIKDSKATPLDFNSMTVDDLKVGSVVEGDIYYNLDAYETVESKTNGKTTSTEYRYLVPFGDEEFIGVATSKSEIISQFDTQANETFDYLDGKIDETSTIIHFKGKIVKMDSEDYGYFTDAVKEMGYTDNEVKDLCPEYYIQIREFGQGGIILIIGIIMVAIAVILCLFIVRKGNKPVPANTTKQSFQDAGQGQFPEPGVMPGQAQQPGGYQNPGQAQQPGGYPNPGQAQQMGGYPNQGGYQNPGNYQNPNGPQ